MLDEEEWCIVKYRNTDTNYDNKGNEIPPKRPYDLLIRKVYQWEAQGDHYRHKWEYLARGLTEQQAKDYQKLFKE